jgi:hypothetical protein
MSRWDRNSLPPASPLQRMPSGGVTGEAMIAQKESACRNPTDEDPAHALGTASISACREVTGRHRVSQHQRVRSADGMGAGAFGQEHIIPGAQLILNPTDSP